jgi:hypothetical protein
MTFKVRFFRHDDRYQTFRPTYPASLFGFLASPVPAHDHAGGCASGNGLAMHPSLPTSDASPRTTRA